MAHAALCQALKAAIAASGHRYQAIHDVDRLPSQFLDIHPDSLLRASISPAIYQQYRDYGANHPAVMPITAVEDYQAQVTQEVQSLLALARDTINSGGEQTAPPLRNSTPPSKRTNQEVQDLLGRPGQKEPS
jgi:hypothetical protein